MKILESQSAILTNFEVYTHLVNQKAKHDKKGQRRRRPGNLETIVKEVSLSKIVFLLEAEPHNFCLAARLFPRSAITSRRETNTIQ